MIKTLLGLLLGSAIGLATPSFAQDYQPLEGDPETLVFGIISTESTQNLRPQWEPFLADMEEIIGMEVEPFFASDYAGVIEGMRFGKVHMAWFGNASAIQAVDRANAEVFARQVKADGTQGYYSHILAHVDNTEVNSLEDMFAQCGTDIDFGIGDPNSTSGFLVPTYYVFAQNEIDPAECFDNVRNANHETNLMAVSNGQVDYAANNSEQVIRSQMNAPDAAKSIKVIWTSPLIPSDPITYRKDLSDELKNKIAAFFLSYGRIGPDAEAQRKVLAGFSDGLAPYASSTNAQLYPIRELDIYSRLLKLKADDRLDAADKEKQIAALEAELEKVRSMASVSF